MPTFTTAPSRTSAAAAAAALLAWAVVCAAGCASSNGRERGESPPPTSADRSNRETDRAGVDLIDRGVLFGNADRKSVRISPDGSKLAYLAPKAGVMNVWVAPIDDLEAAEAVTDNRDRGIPTFRWTYTNDDILFKKDDDGNENWHIHRVDLESGEQTDLTPFDGVKAQIQELSPDRPGTLLAAINRRNPKYHDVYRIDLESGDSEMVEKNDGEFAGWVTDDSLDVRLAVRQTKTGGKKYLKPDGDGGWTPLIEVGRKDALSTQVLGFDDSGEKLHLLDARGRDKAAFVALDLDHEDKTVLFAPERADAGQALRHPTEKYPQAVAVTYKRKEWNPVHSEFSDKLRTAQQVHDGELDVVSRTLDDSTWILAFTQDDGPIRYYRYDSEAEESEFLFVHREDLRDQPLAEMTSLVVESRDGLDLVSYLTLPPWKTEEGKRPTEPIPLVMVVHGGPWSRDTWGYNPFHQWLANRGYAVLSVNFRGSTGFGKSFLNAGDKEWGGEMHDDLLDARKWAIEHEITEPDQVGIMGGSYGGYATLVGMTMTPEKFAAGVDIVGPSNLKTLLESIPPYWKPMFETFATRVGDPRTKGGSRLLEMRSPLNYADQIRNPLLIGQGANDPRVKRSESDQIVEAMNKNDVPVTYVVYPDEGHGFQRPENRMSFFAIAEHFLSERLGGRAQPVGDDFEGSSLRIPEGAKYVPPLRESLCEPKPERCEAE